MRAVDEVVEEQAVPEPPEPVTAPRRRADLLSLLNYVVLSMLVMIQLWRDPNGRVLASNDDDHGVMLFMLAHGERVIFHGDSPFWSDRLNVPDGVNMMANTAMLALTLPVSPITHFLGAGVSVALLLTLGLAGTAWAWYWVLSRHLVTSRVAAWLGGLWCGFAPAMVSHANGHVNFVCQFVIPFIVLQVLRLREPGRAVRGGLILTGLIVLQVFINEEALLFTALALGVFVVAYAAMAWPRAKREARHFLAGLGVAALASGALLAYPLHFQFFRAGSYHGQPFSPDEYVTDLLSVGAFARQSLAGYAAVTRHLSVSATEDNTFFGPIGLVMIVVSVVVLWRSVAARSAAISALVLLLVSMGPRLRVAGHDTSIPLPFGLVSHVPVIDLVSVTRFALVPATIAGVLLAMAADRMPAMSVKGRRWFLTGLVLALVPLIPKPLPVVAGDPLPPFLTQGIYQQYVSDDRSLVTVPLPDVTTGRTGMRWVTLSNLAYRTPRGYFMGPVNPPADDTGSWSAPVRYTSSLLWRVREYGQVPVMTDTMRIRIRQDLTFWRAAVVVLVPNSRNGDALLTTLTDALGPPQLVGGVQMWDVRYLPVPSTG
ncbi:hypothetical protein BJ973_005255 [Actinoplanes tereljensis]|uniref:Glycosyl transferase n=1 Tax=Paractinoplanes tereljensis TaxID=571912 RepID=A0A919NN95_9ACTN|nr:hypothetical protein [Actinoplanes tereljensis]GIF21298.1 glycosyl transferase [Actinoplanes tereljensis]